MNVPEEELRRRIAHMRAEREHVDFMEKTAQLMARRLARGIPAMQVGGMAESAGWLVQINRELREASAVAPAPGELAAEDALQQLIDGLQGMGAVS